MESAVSIRGDESPYAVQLELLLKLPDEIGPEQVNEWTDEEVARLREGLLKYSLQVILDDRNSRSTKSEIWLWLESESCHPFSFSVCATESGADPDGLRASFRYLVSKQEKARRSLSHKGRLMS
jgi:hypothetical protein